MDGILAVAVGENTRSHLTTSSFLGAAPVRIAPYARRSICVRRSGKYCVHGKSMINYMGCRSSGQCIFDERQRLLLVDNKWSADVHGDWVNPQSQLHRR